MSDGNTAFQVGPADITKLIEFAQSMVDALSALKAAQDRMRELEYDLAHVSRERDNMATNYTAAMNTNATLNDRVILLETQMKGTEDELEATQRDRDRAYDQLGATRREADDWQAKYNAEVQQHASTRTERDDYGMKHLEVSEALAQANAKLQKFRELLGMDSGPVANAVVAEQLAPTPEPEPLPEMVPETSLDRPWWAQ